MKYFPSSLPPNFQPLPPRQITPDMPALSAFHQVLVSDTRPDGLDGDIHSLPAPSSDWESETRRHQRVLENSKEVDALLLACGVVPITYGSRPCFFVVSNYYFGLVRFPRFVFNYLKKYISRLKHLRATAFGPKNLLDVLFPKTWMTTDRYIPWASKMRNKYMPSLRESLVKEKVVLNEEMNRKAEPMRLNNRPRYILDVRRQQMENNSPSDDWDILLSWCVDVASFRLCAEFRNDSV